MPIVPFAPAPKPQMPEIDPVYVAMASSEVAEQNKRMTNQSHLDEAHKAMNLSPEERNLYQLHVQNLYGPGGVDHPDGSRSTIYQTVEEHDGKFYNVPTVWHGKIETKEWKDPKTGKVWDIPNETALQNIERMGWDKFPSYSTPQEADKRYQQMHEYFDKDMQDYSKRRKR